MYKCGDENMGTFTKGTEESLRDWAGNGTDCSAIWLLFFLIG